MGSPGSGLGDELHDELGERVGLLHVDEVPGRFDDLDPAPDVLEFNLEGEGGGAFHNNGAIYHWNKAMIEAPELSDPTVRVLDQSRIGPVLAGEPDALFGGAPVTALLVQNTNPVSVAPDQNKVKRGFAREDLFACVHEQFMTETAAMADIVLPATMFME